MSTRNDVSYTLAMQRGRGPFIPVATYATYVDAVIDGNHLPAGYHPRIERVSVPTQSVERRLNKFEWQPGDVELDGES